MDFIDNLRSAWTAHLRSERGERNGDPRDYVYASARRACVRRMALDLTNPDNEPAPDPDAMERMKRGIEREAAIVARLMQIGPRCTPPFSVTEGQRRFEIRDRDDTLLIVGKIDGRLRLSDGQKPVFECKSGRSFERVSRIEDLDDSYWTRHALDQLLSYLYDQNEPWGFFILERGGVPTFLRVDLEPYLERVEAFLRDARTAVDFRFGRGALPYQTEDPAECRRCPHFGRTCDPALDFGEGIRVIENEDLEEAAAVHVTNAAAAKAYNRAHEKLKASLRGVECALLGDFVVTGKWSKNTTYAIPDDVKAKYKTVDPKGKFGFKIQRVAETTETDEADEAS